MTRKSALQLIFFTDLVCALFSTVVHAEIVVREEGDWIEYSVIVMGNVPAEHNVTDARAPEF